MNPTFAASHEASHIPYAAGNGLQAASVLVLAPHPDDEVFGCGGAIARHVQNGVRVRVVVFTDGGLGGDATSRYAESVAAAKILGYGTPVFWEQADRGLLYTEALVQRVLDDMASGGVDLLYAPSPWEIHPDHRQASAIAQEAARRWQGPLRLAFYEVGAPLQPNYLLDISAVLPAKEAAMACFQSQLHNQAYLRQIEGLNRYRTYSLPREVTAAEAFRLVDAADLQKGWADGLRSQRDSKPPGDATQSFRPLVSVLIRSMDLDCIAQALDSIAIQDYAAIEVVVVAARPGHRPLPPRCGPFTLRLVLSDEPLARSRAANRALESAAGEYLVFLDDDDWFMPGHISRLAETLQSYGQVPAVYTGVGMVDGSGAPVGQVFDMPFDPVRLLAGNLTPIHGVMFRKSAVASGCKFEESLDRYEDWDFWLQVSRLGAMVHLPGVSAIYRLHESSGVHQDGGPLGEATQLIYEKWRTRWTPREMGAMMLRVWSHPDIEGRLHDTEHKLHDTEHKLHDTEHKLHDTEHKLHDTEHKLHDTEHKLHDTGQRLQSSELQIAGMYDQLAKQSSTIASQSETLASQAVALQQAVAHGAHIQAQLDAAQSAVQAIFASRSWRWTVGLRALTTWLRNLRS